MVTIDCPPQILVVSDNRKGLISNAGYQYLISHVVIIINTKFMGHMVVVLELFIYMVSHMFQTKYPATEIDGQFVFDALKEFRRRLFPIKVIFSSF